MYLNKEKNSETRRTVRMNGTDSALFYKVENALIQPAAEKKCERLQFSRRRDKNKLSNHFYGYQAAQRPWVTDSISVAMVVFIALEIAPLHSLQGSRVQPEPAAPSTSAHRGRARWEEMRGSRGDAQPESSPSGWHSEIWGSLDCVDIKNFMVIVEDKEEGLTSTGLIEFS